MNDIKTVLAQAETVLFFYLQGEILLIVKFAIHKSFSKIPILLLLLLTQLQIKNPHLDHAGFLFAIKGNFQM